MKKGWTLYLSLGFAACWSLLSPGTQATPLDRSQPTNIEADHVEVDDRTKVATFTGNVLLTQGSLTLRSDKLVAVQDAQGFQKGVASMNNNKRAYISQRRTNGELAEGEAERIEYDGRTEIAEMTGNAEVRSGGDTVRGERIKYNALTEQYQADSTGGKNGGRVHITIPPKNTTGAKP